MHVLEVTSLNNGDCMNSLLALAAKTTSIVKVANVYMKDVMVMHILENVLVKIVDEVLQV